MSALGSSDNAASYGVYAFGLLPRWTALRDSISLSVYYGAEIDLRGSCIVALSQSGETPDVLAYVERARARGALTIAITNDPDSALGEAAEAVLPLAAGPERSIAATKTYTAQVAALALLAGHAAGQGRAIADGIRAVAGQLDDALPALERRLGEIAGAAFSVPVPTPRVTLLSPLLSVVPGQLLAWALAQAKGLDPDRPAGL